MVITDKQISSHLAFIHREWKIQNNSWLIEIMIKISLNIYIWLLPIILNWCYVLLQIHVYKENSFDIVWKVVFANNSKTKVDCRSCLKEKVVQNEALFKLIKIVLRVNHTKLYPLHKNFFIKNFLNEYFLYFLLFFIYFYNPSWNMLCTHKTDTLYTKM